MIANLFAMLIVYLLLRFYLPLDKLVLVIIKGNKKKEEVKEIEECPEDSEDAEPIEEEKEEPKNDDVFTKSVLRSLLYSLFFIIPFALSFIIIIKEKWAQGFIIILAMFIINFICNLLVGFINIKSKKIFGFITDIVLHILVMYFLFTKLDFNMKIVEYSNILEYILVFAFLIKPCGVFVQLLQKDLLDVDEKMFSLDGIIGLFERIIVGILMAANAVLAIPFLLAVIVFIKFKDLSDVELRNKFLLDMVTNVTIPIVGFLLLTMF